MDVRSSRPDGEPMGVSTDAVLVIDDHPLFCDALSAALTAGLGLKHVYVAHDLAAGLAMLGDGLEVGVIALDLNLPDVSGLDGLLRLRAATPDVPVLVVSATADNAMIGRALGAGAMGFVGKDAASETLIAAARAVLEGSIHAPPDYAEPVAGDAAAASVEEAAARLSELTPQQLRILGLVCAGKLNKQIAFDLDIAETTVKAHITAILRKLGVQSRTQAVLVAQRAGYGVGV